LTKDEARTEALRRWRELPPGDRRTHEQAAAFATQLARELDFRTMSEVQKVIMAWLVRDMEGLAETPTPGQIDSPERQARRAADTA
jgi:hypothetical protein